ncbi:unnamed protein product [Ectocarpus sp. 12 AP-2014]
MGRMAKSSWRALLVMLSCGCLCLLVESASRLQARLSARDDGFWWRLWQRPKPQGWNTGTRHPSGLWWSLARP